MNVVAAGYDCHFLEYGWRCRQEAGRIGCGEIKFARAAEEWSGAGRDRLGQIIDVETIKDGFP